jgi:hypothetical protein
MTKGGRDASRSAMLATIPIVFATPEDPITPGAPGAKSVVERGKQLKRVGLLFVMIDEELRKICEMRGDLRNFYRLRQATCGWPRKPRLLASPASLRSW